MFNKYKFLLLSTSLIFMLGVGSWVNTSNQKLKTPEAPLKIISLELAWSAEKAKTVASSWTGKTRELAVHSIEQDYLFILAYTLFLVSCVLARNHGDLLSIITKFFLSLCVLAGVFDVIENIFMTLFLRDQSISPVLFSLPASIKFTFIIATGVYVLLFLRYEFAYVTHLLKAFRLYIAGITTVGVSYWVFIKLTQGQDIVMQIAEYSGPFLWTLVCALLWSGYSWYSSRLISYVKSVQPDNVIPVAFHQHFPRIIAFNAVVSIQAAIMALPTIGWLGEVDLWLFVISQNVLYFIWSDLLTSPDRRRVYTVVMGITLLAYIIVVVSLLQRDALVQHQRWLPVIALVLFVCEMVLIWLFIQRRKRIDRRSSAMDSEVQSPGKLKVLKNIGTIDIPLRFQNQEQIFFNAFNVLAGLGVAFYFIGFFSFNLTNRMGPLGFTFLAFGVLVGLSNIVTYFSIRKKTSLFFLLFAWTIILGRFYDPYTVRLIKTDQGVFYANRPDLKTYFQQWLNHRKSKIDSARKDFPVYLVIADGGASRSGYWVASVLSALQDSTIRKDTSDIFSDHLLCLAGASGGSVGNATFYSLLKTKQRGDATYLKDSRAFLKEDFLTPVITHWLGSDFIQHLIPLPVDDRAASLEQSMEYFADKSLDSTFAKPMTRMLDLTGRLPILFINATHVQQGAPAVVSSIKLKSFSKRLDVLDSVEKTFLTEDKGDIRFSTAVVLGARFPYVSPAGSIGKEYFVDGGYFDNTGAGVVHEMMQMLDSIIKADPAPYAKLNFKLVYISNSSLSALDDKLIHPVVDDLAAPVLTVLGTYASQTSVNNERLLNFMRRIEPADPYVEINLYTKKDSIDYPMNWVISDYNLGRMNERLEGVKSKELKELY